MEPTPTIPPIGDQIKTYLETIFKLLKLESIDKASSVIAEVVTDLVMAFVVIITFIFFSITLALFAAYLLHSAWEGFGCVTLLYLIIVLGAHLLKVRLQNIFIRKFIQKLFRTRNA